MESKKTKHDIEKLNSLYERSLSVDKDIFSEQRSNVMLIAGNHYTGKGAKNWDRIRAARDIPNESKIRLTKNHIQAITKRYLNHLVSASPGVQIVPRNNKEIQDQKCAELNQSVWQYSSDMLKFPIKVMSLAKDYVDLGEAAVKVFWNPNIGTFKGYEQAVDELGQPVVDEMGQPVGDTNKAIFSGQLQIEKILPTNLLRDADCTSMDESPWLCVRKMMPIEDLKKLVGDDPEKLKNISENQREEYMVFDNNSINYTTVKDQVLVREFYFRPCIEYPMGYYYITTKGAVLFEGELPFGVFPIEYVGFDEIQASPRHRSIVKQLRPYQMEINRTASKIAETQVTSDDKLILQGGAKISSGGVLPGIRAIQVSGGAPTVIEGRSGAQYVDYMNGQIAEMNQVAGFLTDEEKMTQADPYGMLFRSVKEQKKFVIYIHKFEDFLKQIVSTYLRLAKQYLQDDMLIPMVGKGEYVNLAEFRSAEDVRTQIKVMPMSDDINSMFGKLLAINHTIQYVGNSLTKEDIGRLLKNVPYGNFDESFSDMTLNYDSATNYILALERGEWVEPSLVDDPTYMLKRIEKRIRESDFRVLNPQIQQMFMVAKQTYEKFDADQKLRLQRAEQGFIPTTGPLVKTDLQIQEPNTTGGFKTTRAAFPVDALSWLQKHLEAQGSSLDNFKTLDQPTQAEIADMLVNQGSAQQLQGQNQTVQGGMNGIGSTNQSY